MSKVRQRDTAAELALRRELYKRNLRYRVNYKILDRPRRVADIAFPGLKVAVFVDGCFWHGCPEHATWPKTNSDFWRSKIEANRARDEDTNARLIAAGWHIVRLWEHECAVDAADRIERLVSSLR
jgi:DNA mismatch endonuclease, patch repair protein